MSRALKCDLSSRSGDLAHPRSTQVAMGPLLGVTMPGLLTYGMEPDRQVARLRFPAEHGITGARQKGLGTAACRMLGSILSCQDDNDRHPSSSSQVEAAGSVMAAQQKLTCTALMQAMRRSPAFLLFRGYTALVNHT